MDSGSRGNAALQDLFFRSPTPPGSKDTIGNIYSGQNLSTDQVSSLFPRGSDPLYENESGRAKSPHMPGSLHDDPAVTIAASNADRQSTLLSLLSTNPNPRPQQVGTPPAHVHHSGDSSPTGHNEAQGKLLLEQLMAGNPSAGSQRSLYADRDAGGSPQYGPAIHNTGDYSRPAHSHEASIDLGPHPSQSLQNKQQQAPPPDKSMFDFVSPFDALSNASPAGSATSAPGPTKPKPIPQPVQHPDAPYTAPDPRRASVDNLLESLTRAPVSASSGTPPHQPSSYGSYSVDQPEYGSPSQSHSFLTGKGSPARSSPQKQARSVDGVGRGRNNDSPASLQQQQPRRDTHTEGSPVPAQSIGRGSNRGKKNKNNGGSPAPQPQTVVFDVAQQLPGIQAPVDYVKTTPIALVRQDAVFLPGTTIGATSWVAYAMTRGRVRVISRSSGDRTLLNLPASFPSSSTVVDMATYRNRLAGVTSDGGFVVWELPETITDDAPGTILLCVQPPHPDSSEQGVTEAPLHLAKWHPQDPDTLAVASENRLYLINLSSVAVLQGHPVPQYDLHHVSHVFIIPTPLVAFDFDVLHYALATISEDSTLTLWNINDHVPYTQHKVRGEDIPSSIAFVDGAVVIGRKNGTIYQLLNVTTKAVLATIKFVNSANPDDIDMFGHAHYDSRVGTLWIANSRRESMIAFKLNFDSFASDPGALNTVNYIEQVVEFTGPKPTIHFVILTVDGDPTGEEAHAACIAAKVPSGDLSLVAFSVHAGGVDQILIRKEWLETALNEASEKIPSGLDHAHSRGQGLALTQQPLTASAIIGQLRVSPEEEAELDNSTRDDGPQNGGNDRPERGREPKGKGKRNVNWKADKDNNNDVPLVGNASKGGKSEGKDNGSNESPMILALNREMKKTEESLHTKIGRLLAKELDKQNQRVEEARAHDMQQDFARQEKLLQVISTELTKNTTRVVDSAVKTVITQSVLPVLEQITKKEIASALDVNVGQGLSAYITQNLPQEVEKLLLRPDVSSHFTQIFTSQVAPTLERQIREAVSKSFLPTYTQLSGSMHHEVLKEIHNVKSELSAWQAETFRTQESVIQELQSSVAALTEQLKYINGGSFAKQQPPNAVASQFLPPQQASQGSPGGPPPFAPAPASYGQGAPVQPAAPPPQWFNNAIAAPQASHPASIPQPPQQQDAPSQSQSKRTPPTYNPNAPKQPESWDSVYLDVLGSHDPAKLQDLLGRTNPDEILPKNGPQLVSQAVVLSLVHRLSAVVGESSPTGEEYKSSMWWLHRCVFLLRPQDKVIADFIPRTIPTVHQWLNQAKQRVVILPNAPGTYEASRMLTDIQEELIRRGGRPS